jgi:hypothetical protein
MLQIASQHASTVGTAGSKSSKSMAALNNAVRHATDGFIGILDMFGFEDPKVSSHVSVLKFLLPKNLYLQLSVFNITCTECQNIHVLYSG